MEKSYVITHCHTMLSNCTVNIDSITRYQDYIDIAKENGMKAIAFTEHGNLYEWWHKKCAVEKAGMKYIHAVEAYITETLDEKIRDNLHCVLIARNYDGFKELNRLVTASYDRKDNHFYYVPRISIDELCATSNNIIITTACLGGVLAKGSDTIKTKFLEFCVVNKHRVFLEVQHHSDKEGRQIKYNQYLAKISSKYEIPLIVGTDTHALNKIHLDGRKKLQEGKDVFFSDEEEWDLSFKTYDELCEIYRVQGSLPEEVYLEAIDNTNKLADMVEEFSIDRCIKYPKIYENPLQTFKDKINKAYKSHPYIKSRHDKQTVKDRVNEELDVYIKTNSIDFMLLQAYMREWEKQNDIKCGYGRGSVSGSLIAYLLGITEMDSIRFDLNFFRFMNPSRVSNADIDTDYSSDDRDKVKEFLLKHHMDLPQISTCEIVTFNTIALKGAIRDIGRAFKMPLEEVDQICNRSDDEKDLKKLRKEFSDLFKYVDIVQGTIVSVGVHPSGVLISDKNLIEEIGLCTFSTSDYQISMLNMKELDDLFYVKLDILGLDNIGVINDTCEMVGIDRLSPDNVDLEDMNVWKSIREDTTLIFQWESNSAQAYLKKFMSDETLSKVKTVVPNFSMIKWLSFGNGLIRPACESYRDDVAKGEYYNNGLKELDEFLAPTLGHVTMQEDIMKFLVRFCGYSEVDSDSVRRIIGKKLGTEQVLPEVEERFIKYSSKTYSIAKEKCAEIIKPFLEVILSASAYGFSWNHSDSYSCIGYICGYLRYYYPLEFITCALNIFEGKEDKTISIIKYAKNIGISISPIRFRHTQSSYSYDKKTNTIYKGMASIKYLNNRIPKELYDLRNEQYNNFAEVLADINSKTTVNSKQLEILVKLSFFEEFGEVNELLKVVEIYNYWHNKKQVKKEEVSGLSISLPILKQFCKKETDKLFKDFDSVEIMSYVIKNTEYPETNINNKINYELDNLGYIQMVIPNMAIEYAYVTDIETKYKNPVVKLYRLNNGDMETVKVKAKQYEGNEFKKGEIIKTIECSDEKKWYKDSEGEWQQKDETEVILKKWAVVR